jgi:hypothetical protein
MTTKREKLQAMAGQTVSPAEATVAKSLLAKTGTPLERIAENIREEWGKGIDAQFAVGHRLIEARDMFPQDVEFGKWFKSEDFPFQLRTAHRLREAAAREPEVRALLSGQSAQTDRSVSGAVQLLNAGPKEDAGEIIPVTDETPMDRSYAALRDATYGIIGTDEEPKNTFLSMHVDDLAKCAGFIKALATAYNEAKSAYSEENRP